VTPAGINPAYSGDNFGLQDVLVDPVRPSDLYTFVCHEGVWRSTDYGQTWAKVNKGTNGSAIDGGKPWSAGIDSNRCRDPGTPPTLYTLSGNGNNGFWKSTDGGVNWTRTDFPSNSGAPNPQDGYSIDVDPYDGAHVIVGFHEETGFVESRDAGQTWHVVSLASGMHSGISWYGFFIDTGDPATTATTWLLLPQDDGSGVGTWRTTNSGATWNKVESVEHPHGDTQIFQGGGAVYIAGDTGSKGPGVYRTTDAGATWTHVGSNGAQAVVYGTGKNIYAQYSWACGGCNLDESKSESAPFPGTTWSTFPMPMANGPKRAAVTYDGAHYVVVSGNWNAGIWRYVEP
jgi:hypothetical protein